MNKYLKEFLHRGLIFGGFGPIIAAIVYMIISLFIDGVSVSGGDLLIIVVSTYLLAFVHAGASIFNQIEEWPTMKSLLCHFAAIYISYSLCYLINSWIPFDPMVLIIFTAIFVALYLVIWFCVYFSVRAYSKRLNKNL